MWIAHLDRLPTRSRLASWGLNTPTTCCLCDTHLESRDHLLLHCEISEQLWNLVLHRLGYRSFYFHTWTALSEWLSISDQTCPPLLRKLSVHAVIYSLWTERNRRLHDGTAVTPATLFKLLDRFIRDALLGHRKQRAFQPLMRLWLQYE
ncbi:uncharacterized protein LOC106372875 [Brassica napus]|uniref:uncharacterized protein LOC106324365 n=1 Tax=Brassica oleracea var. oleracea TaxID=109376 RepID=UPI0006A6BA97|nr:PREDICTED: uncharacterized protein LOC106324365 [Brassica oleracea var. oleracea]XP_013668593.2 uncharacterized protein LOC106372875 [Brassica napus]